MMDALINDIWRIMMGWYTLLDWVIVARRADDIAADKFGIIHANITDKRDKSLQKTSFVSILDSINIKTTWKTLE